MQIENKHVGRINIPIGLVNEYPDLLSRVFEKKIVITAEFNYWRGEIIYTLIDLTKKDFKKIEFGYLVPFYDFIEVKENYTFIEI